MFTVPPHSVSTNMQQTPKPAAQFPSLDPPWVTHSEAERQVPRMVGSETVVHNSFYNKSDNYYNENSLLVSVSYLKLDNI